MTDIWDTLWGFWDAGKVDPFALETCFPDFIKKIRAEGDRLKEKAEKYDLIANNYFEVSNDGTTWNTTNLSKVIEAVEKIEAVKTWARNNSKKDPEWLACNENIKLVKILEAGDV